MPDLTASSAGEEARQSILRVWMAISAVWVAFWLLLAAIAVFSAEVRNPLLGEFGPFCVILLTPPIALLGFGSALWLLFSTLLRYAPARRTARARAGGN